MDWQVVLKTIVNNYQMRTFGIMLAVNLALGILAALHRGDFKLWAVADFTKRMLIYGGAYGLMKLVAVVDSTFVAIATAIWGFIVLAMTGHILAALKDLGLPTNGMVGRAIEK